MFSLINLDNISNDQSYKDAITKCMKEWSSAKTNKELLDAIIFASQTYMLPKEIWKKAVELATSEPEFNEKQRLVQSLIKPTYFQYYFDLPFYVYFPHRKDVNWMEKDEVHDVPQKYANFCFSFPHKSLDKMWKHYCEHITAPPPLATVNSYKRMKKLYNDLEEVEDYIEKWYEVLKQVDDKVVVEHNLEYRLGLNLNDKKLWKIYMDFLEETNIKKLFQAYEKYCRFFLADDDMKIKYNKSALKYEYFIPEDVFVPGEPEEISLDEIWDEDYYINKCNPPPCPCYYNADNMAFQNFPFQKPIINYIIKNAKGEILQKLYKTCKLFYTYFPAQICYKFDLSPWSNPKRFNFDEESVRMSHFLLEDANFDRIIILNSFCLMGSYNDANFLRKQIIPRLYKCEAKHINISMQNLNLNEFEMLVEHGNVVNLDLSRVEITDSKTGELSDAADILKLTPKVEFISLFSINYTDQTIQKLLEIPFQNKIQEFTASFLVAEIEPFAFANFLMKNISSTCELFISFEALSDDIFENFHALVQYCIDEYWTGKHKPTFEGF